MCTRSSERAERWHICLRVSFSLPEFEVALLPGRVCIFLCRGQGRLIINQSSLCPSPSVWAHAHLTKRPRLSLRCSSSLLGLKCFVLLLFYATNNVFLILSGLRTFFFFFLNQRAENVAEKSILSHDAGHIPL